MGLDPPRPPDQEGLGRGTEYVQPSSRDIDAARMGRWVAQLDECLQALKVGVVSQRMAHDPAETHLVDLARRNTIADLPDAGQVAVSSSDELQAPARGTHSWGGWGCAPVI